jgi:hypothetical protein
MLEMGRLAASASAIAQSQPVMPPIFMMSGMARSEASASIACAMSARNQQFSPVWIGIGEAARARMAHQVLDGDRLLHPGEIIRRQQLDAGDRTGGVLRLVQVHHEPNLRPYDVPYPADQLGIGLRASGPDLDLDRAEAGPDGRL